jgi:hypothetical protein
MSERALNVVAWTTGSIVAIIGGCLWLALLALIIIIVLGGANDLIFNVRNASWEKPAILLTFIFIFLMRRRLRLLDEKIDEIRMMTAATCCYLDIEFRNRALDLPPGLGAVMLDNLRRGLFRNKLLDGCYAARDGRKVTLADDLKSAGLA